MLKKVLLSMLLIAGVSGCAFAGYRALSRGTAAETAAVSCNVAGFKSGSAASGRSPLPTVPVDGSTGPDGNVKLIGEAEPLSGVLLAEKGEGEEPAGVSLKITENAGEKASAENKAGTEAETEKESEAETEIRSETEQKAETEEDGSAEEAAATGTDTSEIDPAGNTAGTGYSEILAEMGYTPDEMTAICDFYDGSVFVGDSVLLGFRRYADRSSDPMLKKMKFLTAGSFSLHNSFWDVSKKSVHPLYQGNQYHVWDSISMIGAKRAFLFFGINDVSYGVEASVPLYPQLVAKIQERSPGIEINIISATYTLQGKGKGGLNNQNIAAFNSSVMRTAAQNGWGYIDIATVLSDGAGNLAPQYCSDGNLHESWSAYKVWTQELARFAARRLGLTAR